MSHEGVAGALRSKSPRVSRAVNAGIFYFENMELGDSHRKIAIEDC